MPASKPVDFAQWIGEKLSNDDTFMFFKHNAKWYVHGEGYLTSRELFKHYQKVTAKEQKETLPLKAIK